MTGTAAPTREERGYGEPPRRRAPRRRPLRWLLAATAALVVGVSGIAYLAQERPELIPGGDHCRVSVEGRTVSLSTDQAVEASAIVAEAIRSGTADESVSRLAGPTGPGLSADDAGAVASALTGRTPAALTCRASTDVAPGSTTLGPRGLTPRAYVVRRDLDAAFGPQKVGGFAPGGVSTGHMPGSAHYEGRAVDVFVRPVSAANQQRGWAMAAYLVANAERLDVATVIFDDQIWTARRSLQGWRDYGVDTSGRSARTAAILEHRDHVHLDIFR